MHFIHTTCPLLSIAIMCLQYGKFSVAYQSEDQVSLIIYRYIDTYIEYVFSVYWWYYYLLVLFVYIYIYNTLKLKAFAQTRHSFIHIHLYLYILSGLAERFGVLAFEAWNRLALQFFFFQVFLLLPISASVATIKPRITLFYDRRGLPPLYKIRKISILLYNKKKI